RLWPHTTEASPPYLTDRGNSNRQLRRPEPSICPTPTEDANRRRSSGIASSSQRCAYGDGLESRAEARMGVHGGRLDINSGRDERPANRCSAEEGGRGGRRQESR